MNDVFPEIYSAPLAEVEAGSIAIVSSGYGPLLILVTSESVQENLRSVVILNLPEIPTVVLHQNWEGGEMCLYYKTRLRFELSNKEGDIDTTGNWWRRVGVIVSTKDEFLIRAAGTSRGGFRYVNVQTGSVFSGELPITCATFGVWSLWLRDPVRERSFQVFDFNILK